MCFSIFHSIAIWFNGLSNSDWINIASVAINFALAWVAIFGSGYLRKIDVPDLELSLLDKDGDLTRGAYYYHVVIKNRKPNTVAKRLALFCTRIEIADSSGKFERIKAPRYKLQWPYQQNTFGITPPTLENRDVYDEEQCDFLQISQGPYGLQVVPLVTVEGASVIVDKVIPSGHFRCYIKAYADNYQSSRPLILEVKWKLGSLPIELQNTTPPGKGLNTLLELTSV